MFHINFTWETEGTFIDQEWHQKLTYTKLWRNFMSQLQKIPVGQTSSRMEYFNECHSESLPGMTIITLQLQNGNQYDPY